MPARFHDNDIASKLKNKRKLSAFLDDLVHKHLKNVEKISLDYIFCTDAYLLSINQQFLNHKTLTDIITFDLSENETMLQGEIYVSVERVKENAEKFDVGYEEELHRVIFHGALHLCGYKDKSEADIKKMRAGENNCLKQYFNSL
jgi:probable rRNA maturation factor